MTAVDPAHDDRPAPHETRADEPASRRRSAVFTRLLLWLVFGVVIGALPLYADGVKEALSAGGFRFNDVLGQGELLIVAAVIAAGAMGELFIAKISDKERNYSIVACGFCLLFCIGNTLAYASSTATAACANAEQSIAGSKSVDLAGTVAALQSACQNSAVFSNPATVAHLSIGFFIPTVLLSAACIGMAAGR
jgi:hypothetical protein